VRICVLYWLFDLTGSEVYRNILCFGEVSSMLVLQNKTTNNC
jgi:hypothetical protein